jgi:hypothetical protein
MIKKDARYQMLDTECWMLDTAKQNVVPPKA